MFWIIISGFWSVENVDCESFFCFLVTCVSWFLNGFCSFFPLIFLKVHCLRSWKHEYRAMFPLLSTDCSPHVCCFYCLQLKLNDAQSLWRSDVTFCVSFSLHESHVPLTETIARVFSGWLYADWLRFIYVSNKNTLITTLVQQPAEWEIKWCQMSDLV